MGDVTELDFDELSMVVERLLNFCEMLRHSGNADTRLLVNALTVLNLEYTHELRDEVIEHVYEYEDEDE